MPNIVIPLSEIVSLQVFTCPLTTEPSSILATVRHKTQSLPRKNEAANVEAVFNVLETLSSSRLLRSFSFGVCNMSWTRFPHPFVHMSAPCPNPGTRQPLGPS